ncbi:hypothetical protein SAMN05421759_109118 [Roseivivax lentus]|uniref:Uncharacterized protein n=1 Tax=Roseivivax lentus TaxID=633194 RepID=A0A1N7NQI8_9RHOB|nr:hypothetical protein [Roseivivax lentus]SIT00499.1 hypothetical protein SAMN05421759_109118 [Roseivivax lentus]
MTSTLTLIATLLLSGTSLAVAQTHSSGHVPGMDHAAHGQSAPPQEVILTEPGQGAFAALSEVVRALEADPETDWSRVDLAGLRAHLVDMDRVITDTIVDETHLPDGLSAMATGDAATIAALHRMVPAHAAQLTREDRWTATTIATDDGVELRVTSADPATVARIRALGFFGLMASQDHHRAHHMLMARGEEAHAH